MLTRHILKGTRLVVTCTCRCGSPQPAHPPFTAPPRLCITSVVTNPSSSFAPNIFYAHPFYAHPFDPSHRFSLRKLRDCGEFFESTLVSLPSITTCFTASNLPRKCLRTWPPLLRYLAHSIFSFLVHAPTIVHFSISW